MSSGFIGKYHITFFIHDSCNNLYYFNCITDMICFLISQLILACGLCCHHLTSPGICFNYKGVGITLRVGHKNKPVH